MVLLFKLLNLSLKTWKAQSKCGLPFTRKDAQCVNHRRYGLRQCLPRYFSLHGPQDRCQFHTIHGRTNAILASIRYPLQRYTQLKTATWPKYNYYRADEKYQDIARMLGLPCSTPEEAVEAYAKLYTNSVNAVVSKWTSKHKESMKRMEETFSWIGLPLLTKINVHQLTHVFQW